MDFWLHVARDAYYCEPASMPNGCMNSAQSYLSRNLAICTVIQYIRLKWKYHNPCSECATYCVSTQFYWFLLLSLSSVSNAPISQLQAKVQFSYFVMVRQNWIILDWLHSFPPYPHSLLHNFQYARIVSCGLEVSILVLAGSIEQKILLCVFVCVISISCAVAAQ